MDVLWVFAEFFECHEYDPLATFGVVCEYAIAMRTFDGNGELSLSCFVRVECSCVYFLSATRVWTYECCHLRIISCFLSNQEKIQWLFILNMSDSCLSKYSEGLSGLRMSIFVSTDALNVNISSCAGVSFASTLHFAPSFSCWYLVGSAVTISICPISDVIVNLLYVLCVFKLYKICVNQIFALSILIKKHKML